MLHSSLDSTGFSASSVSEGSRVVGATALTSFAIVGSSLEATTDTRHELIPVEAAHNMTNAKIRVSLSRVKSSK